MCKVLRAVPGTLVIDVFAITDPLSLIHDSEIQKSLKIRRLLGSVVLFKIFLGNPKLFVLSNYPAESEYISMLH